VSLADPGRNPRSPSGRHNPADRPPSETKGATSSRLRQSPTGILSREKGPGITALVRDPALLRSKRATPAEPAITRAGVSLKVSSDPKNWRAWRPKGSSTSNSNYGHSIALMALPEATPGPDTTPDPRPGSRTSRPPPLGQGESRGRDDPFSTDGAGYGARAGPDLSNTSFFLEALHDTGLPADDRHLEEGAGVSSSSARNLKGGFQTTLGRQGNDGGFIYSAAGRWA